MFVYGNSKHSILQAPNNSLYSTAVGYNEYWMTTTTKKRCVAFILNVYIVYIVVQYEMTARHIYNVQTLKAYGHNVT